MKCVDEKITRNKHHHLIFAPASQRRCIEKDNFVKGDIHRIEKAVHDDLESKVQAKFHGTAKREAQKMEVEAQISHIPTPVYFRLPFRHISRTQVASIGIQMSITINDCRDSAGVARPRINLTGPDTIAANGR